MPQQLRQVINELNLDTSRYLLTRCLICNQELTPKNKTEVQKTGFPPMFMPPM